MRDKWRDASSDQLRGYPPLWKPEIYHCMNDESQDNHEENLERPDAIAIIFFCYAREPEPEEKEGNPEHDGFPENLDHTSKFWSYE